MIGCPGSGKSTFAKALQQATGLPLFHLDMLYWNADRTTVEKEVFRQRLAQVLRQPAWIIDGNYASTMELRLQECDTVFFLDYPVEICLEGIRERRGKKRSDIPWVEIEEDAEFLEFIRNFQTQSRPQIFELLEKYPHKSIHRFTGREEATAFLATSAQWENEKLIAAWKKEEEIAHIHGWDFSHIDGRCEEAPLPWEYRQIIGEYLTPDKKLLDIDTGGGEFLLSLHHPHAHTAATENYPPNVQLCRQTLLPLGIDFRQADGNGKLPFPDGSFHMVIDRHGDFNPGEIYRVLKPGGIFIMQQVGAENERELVQLLCGNLPLPFPEQYADKAAEQFRRAGFSILRQEECFCPIRFLDVGALVWFARILPWEFPDFSVDTHLDRLLTAQRIVEEKGCIEGRAHRFLLVAQK